MPFDLAINNALIGATDSSDSKNISRDLTPGVASYAANTLGSTGSIYRSLGNGQVLSGTAYNDIFVGSHGVDTLIGHEGDDEYFVYSAKTQIYEFAGEGFDSIFSAVNGYKTNASIEQIKVLDTTGYSAFSQLPDHLLKNTDVGWHIYGNSQNQTLIGGKQADYLDGFGGYDTLIGGAGDDVYVYTGTETILESVNQGFDIVKTSSSIELPSNIEVGLVDVASKFVNITGNSLDNILVGGSDSNTLNGGSGNDTLVGAGGDDLYIGGTGSDTFVINGFESFAGEIQDYQPSVDKIVFSISSQSQPVQLSFSNDVFHGVSGEVLLLDRMIQADWNGDSISDILLLVNALPDQQDISFMDPKDLPGF